MKYLLFLSLLVPLNILAVNQTDSLMNVLLDDIKHYDKYEDIKISTINAYKDQLVSNDLTDMETFQLNQLLAKAYNKYQSDSVEVYLKKNLSLAQKMNNDSLVLNTKLDLIPIYATIGKILDADSLLTSVDRTKLPISFYARYYRACEQFYSKYYQLNSDFRLYDQHNLYVDSMLIHLNPSSYLYQTEFAGREVYQKKNWKSVIPTLKKLLGQMEIGEEYYGVTSFLIAESYMFNNQIDSAKYFYALSSISDIRHVSKDNASMHCLAALFFNQGDIDEANLCINKAIQDAMFCNMKNRAIENIGIYPLISSTYQIQEAKLKTQTQGFLFLSICACVLLIISLIYIYKQVKKLSNIRKELSKTNKNLSHSVNEIKAINKNLEESNKEKIKYIAYSFNLCFNYIGQINHLGNSIITKIKTQKSNDILKSLESGDYISKELKNFYVYFDQIFIGLFPSFFDDVNLVLEDEYQIQNKKELTPELRILALIKLGIQDNNTISEYLHYSLSTIYNYKTKLVSWSKLPKDEFYKYVMDIGNQEVNIDDIKNSLRVD